MCHKAAIALTILAALSPAVAVAENFTLRPSITFEERYDSNVRFRGSGTSDRGDLITSAIPQIKFMRKRARYDLDGQYSLEANYHAMNPELNNLSHRAYLDATIDLSKRTRLNVGDSFAYDKDSIRAADTGILVQRTNITANGAYAGVTREMSGKWELGLMLRDRLLEFGDPTLVDSRSDSVALQTRYRYSKSGAANLSYEYTKYRFDTEKNVETHALMLGATEDVSPSTTVNISGGAVYAPSLDGNGKYFLVANAGIAAEYKDSTVNLSYRREVGVPTGLTDLISVSDRVAFAMEQKFSRAVVASVFGDITKTKTEPSSTVDVNSYNVGARAGWQPYMWLGLGAGISHYQQWSGDDLGVGLARNIIYVNVTFTGNDWRF